MLKNLATLSIISVKQIRQESLKNMKLFKFLVTPILALFILTSCSTVSSLTGKDLDLKQALELAKNNKAVENYLGQYGIKLPNDEAPKTPDLISSGTTVNIAYRLKSSGMIISPEDIEIVKWVTVAEPFPLAVPQSDKYKVKVNAPAAPVFLPSSPLSNSTPAVVTNTPVVAPVIPVDIEDSSTVEPVDILDGPDNATVTP